MFILLIDLYAACGICMWGYPLDSQKVNPPVEMVFVNVRGDKPVRLKSIAGA